MFNQLKEKFRLYFLSPLRLFFFRLRQSGKNTGRNYWLALGTVIILTASGLLVARLFLDLSTAQLPADDHSMLGQLKMQAQKFINFAGNNFLPVNRQAEERAAAIREQKNQELQAKLNSMEKFSRVTFFYTSPYLASVAISATWEKKYRTTEDNNLIDFYYAPTAEEGYPLFQIGILSRDEWEKKSAEKKDAQVLSMVSNFVFFYQVYSAQIKNPVKQEDYNGMQKQVKSVLDSFKSYKQ